jgi:hypothetical protein
MAMLPFILILLFFLPTLIEVKKPKDSGPRRILEKEIFGINHLTFLGNSLDILPNLEDEYFMKQKVSLIELIDILWLIPNIET